MRKILCDKTIIMRARSLGAFTLFAASTAVASVANAQTSALPLEQNVPVILPNSSSSYNQQGFNLPSAPRASGQDIIRGAGGVSCQSAVGGNGPTLDMGVIGTNDIFSRDSTALYGRVTVQLGKKPQRVDCNRLYNLEVERLKMEIQLLRAGSLGGGAYDDPAAVRDIMTRADSPAPAPRQIAQGSQEDDLPGSASISPFQLGGVKANAPIATAPALSMPVQTQTLETKPVTPRPVRVASATPNIAPKVAKPIAPKPRPMTPAKTQAVFAPALPEAAIALANLGDGTSHMQISAGTEYFAQMGAFSTLANAQRAWDRFSQDLPDDLPSAYAIANPVKRSGRTLYLLQAGPYSKSTSKRLCQAINSGCYPVRS